MEGSVSIGAPAPDPEAAVEAETEVVTEESIEGGMTPTIDKLGENLATMYTAERTESLQRGKKRAIKFT